MCVIKIRTAILICFLLMEVFLPDAKAQQKPVYSQYMFNGLVLNPAYAGSQKQLSATAIYRKQWVNIDGAPSTMNASIHSGLEKKNVGVGFMVTNESIGIHNDLGMYLSYAYQIKMENGTLAMGLQGGFNNLATDFNKLNLKHGRDPILFGRISNFNPNFGTGLYYSTQMAYVGLSVPYILNNRVFEHQEIVNFAREKRYYFLSAGKVFDVSPSVRVKPSTLLRVQEGAPVGYDVNFNVILDDIVSLGSSYRSNDAVVLLFHLIANENFTFGYAYDWTMSSLNPHTRGSHEIMVNYRIKLTSTPCHAFF